MNPLYAPDIISAYNPRMMAGTAEYSGESAAIQRNLAEGWAALAVELNAWAAKGLQATLWWRDDDATRPGPLLDRLLALARDVPLNLAVIPAEAQPSLARRLREHLREGGAVSVLQHGYAHANHAPAPEKKAEYGPHRPVKEMIAELTTGRERMETLFGALFAPVLTPPWNRIAEELVPLLPEAGLYGLSCYGVRGPSEASRVVNTYVDIIDWRGARGFTGEAAALALLTGHLAARRTGAAEFDEPTGILTHHRDHDAGCWDFLARLIAAVRDHPAALWTAGPGVPRESDS